MLDPRTNTATTFRAPVRDADTPSTLDDPVTAPSPYWGDEKHLGQPRERAQPDARCEGPRLVHGAHPRPANPAFCRKGSDHPSAKAFPLERSGRQLAVYDPATGSTRSSTPATARTTCSSRDDANDTLWTSGGGQVVGWLDTKRSTPPATRPRRRAGRRMCSTPTATAEARPTGSSRGSRRIRAARHAHRGGFYAVMPNPGRLGLGLGRLPVSRAR
jgi:hypothetical protein